MTEDTARSTSDPAPPGPSASTDLELLAGINVLGVRVEASATLATGKDTILAARFRDLTLGEVLTYLVDLAEPGLNFSLDPPWDALNSIRLDDFAFEVDLTQFRIGFRYDGLAFHFPLASLDRIEVWYSPATRAHPKSVDISLFGSFLGIDFTAPPGLTWDALSQPAPAVPGQGTKYFDLEYLAIGQHVSLRDPAAGTTLEAVVKALEGSYAAVDRRSNPLAALPALRFDPTASWLVGLKFSALETLTLAAVYDDPALFGLRVALDGPRAKLLAGLAFEILYRRINDHLGVYHIELKLPDVLRKIELGEATLTLPVIDLDIYTNGDFLLDLGFPHNLDFSRSFQIDMILWVGPIPVPVSAAGGLYFGVLSGESSTQVPAITNGTFAPVIVAGLGVRLGLGKSLSIGPLDAGFFAGIVGILEGVLAWFHPHDPAIGTQTYFKVRGTVGIQIHIWGRVDFSILQASLDILAYATASVAIESYAPIEVGFSAGVSVELSVKVLFFHITLRFSATITESFTIGQQSPTPWQLDSGAPAAAPAVQAQRSQRALMLASGQPVRVEAAFARVLDAGVDWHEQPHLVSAAAQPPRTLTLYAHPMPTAARPDDRPGGHGEAAPQPHLVMSLFLADHGQLEGALGVANRDTPLTAGRTLTLLDKSTHEIADGDTFATLALAGASGPAPDADVFALAWLNRAEKGLLAGSAAAPLPVRAPEGFVTADGVDVVVRDDRQSLTDLAGAFLSPFEQLAREGLLWAVESVSAGLQAEGTPGPDDVVTASSLHAVYLDLVDPARPLTPERIAGFFSARRIGLEIAPMPASTPNPSYTVFPMPPFLTMAVPDQPAVDFGSQPYLVTSAYARAIAAFVRDLAAPGTPGPAARGSGTRQPADGADAPSSVAGVLFADWFTFLERQVVQEALDVFRSVEYRPPPGSTQTLADIADAFGLTDPDLVELNRDLPGLVVGGQTVTFADSSTVTSSTDDTLGTLAERSRHSLADLAAAITAQPGLLTPGAVLALVGGGRHVVVSGDTLHRIATSRQDAVGDAAAVTALAHANKANEGFYRAGSAAGPGTALTIAERVAAVLGGETLRTFAARLQLTPLVVALAAQDDPGLLAPGSTVTITGARYVARPGESLAGVATRLGLSLDVVVTAAATVPGLVKALVPLSVGGASITSTPVDTLASLAKGLGVPLTVFGAAVADRTDLLYAGVACALPDVQHVVAATGPESVADIAARYRVPTSTVVAGGNADALALLPGAQVVFGLQVSTRVGESLKDLAARVQPDSASLTALRLGTALRDRAGLLAPGAALKVNPGSAANRPAGYVIRATDTLPSIAALFGTTPGALVAANPGVTWYPTADSTFPRPGMGISLPVGVRITLPPDLSYRVRPADTLASIADSFDMTVADLLTPASGNDAAPELLAGQVTVALPPFSHPVATGETPLAVAARYGLPVDALVAANLDGPFDTVLVPDAEVLPLADLLATLTASGAFDRPAGALARFLLHGLRLPAPDGIPSDGTEPDWSAVPQYPLHTITGQQITPPSPLPAGFAVTLGAAPSAPPSLVTFAGGGSTLAVPVDEAAVAGIAAQLAPQAGSSPFDIEPLSATPYPAVVVVPQQFALGDPVPWLPPAPVLRYHPPAGTAASGGDGGTSSPVAGTPTLHPFPAPLRTRIRAGVAGENDPSLRLTLQVGSKTTGSSPTQAVPITGFGWATRVDLGVRQTLDPAGQVLPYVHEIFGTDPNAIDDLRMLVDHLRAGGADDVVDVRLLYAANPAGSGTTGLQSDPVRPEDVLLVKANLSTVSQPPTPLAIALFEGDAPASTEPAPLTAASMDPVQARDFLTLVWEAAVTNSGGYFLLYRVGGSGGSGLPPYLFEQNRSGTVSLLVTLLTKDSAASPAPTTADVRPFCNTALVTENLADPTAPVYVAPQRYPVPKPPGTLQTLADALGVSVQTLGAANAATANLVTPGRGIAVAPGTPHVVVPGETLLDVATALGVRLADVVAVVGGQPGALRPGTGLHLYPDWLTAGSALRPGAAGFRILRSDPDPDAVNADVPATDRTGQDDPATKLAVLFNLLGYRLADGDFHGSADGLPVGPAQQGGADPAGAAIIEADGTAVWTYAKQVQVDRFAVRQSPDPGVPGPDPYGGVGGTAEFLWNHQDVFGNRILPARTLAVPIRYTDALVGLAQWPAIVAAYRVLGEPRAAQLSVRAGLDAGTYVAPPGDPVAPLGPEGGAGVTSGLAARANADRDVYATIAWQLAGNVTAAVTTSLDGREPHPVETAALAGLASAAWRYLGTVAALQPLTVATDGQSLGAIAALYQVSPGELALANRSAGQNAAAGEILRPGAGLHLEQRSTVAENDTLRGLAGRAPTGAWTTAADLAAGNPGLPLQAGALLMLARPGPAPAPDQTLAAVAAAAGLSVLQWVSANDRLPGLFVPGAVLTVPGRNGGTRGVTVAVTDTLRTIAVRADLPVGDLALSLAALPGLLSPDAEPMLPVPVPAASQDTLGSLAARFHLTAAQFAAVNADAGGLLRTGSPLTLPQGGSGQVLPQDTLLAIAGRTGVAVETLAALNADQAGLLGSGPLVAPYSVVAGDTLASVAAGLPAVLPESLTARDVGAANADVPGLFTPGGSLLLGTRDYTVQAGDTFASIAQAQGGDVAGIGAANASVTDLFAPGHRLAVPRHAVLGEDVSATVAAEPDDTIGGLAGAHHLDVAVLAAANADLVGVLRTGTELHYLASTGATYSTTTRDGDTISTVTTRLQAALLADAAPDHVTPARLGAANPAAPLVSDARLLLPPPDVDLTVPVTVPDGAALLDVEVSLTLARSRFVDPALADAPGVASVTTPLSPDLGTGTDGGPLALALFAETFEHAFSDVDLKLTTTTRGTGSLTDPPRFLAVRYPSPVLSVGIDGAGASFLAPPPLSTQPWSSPTPVPIRTYVSGKPLGEARPTSFSGVDLDLWGRAFLGVLDRALSADYAVPAYTRDPDAYVALLQAKGVLAQAISAAVVPIVNPPDGGADGRDSEPAAALEAARETLRQRLLVTLSEAYQLDAIVQFPVAVVAPAQWPTTAQPSATAPRLHGQAHAATYRVPEASATTTDGDTLASIAEANGSTARAVGEDNAALVGLLRDGVSLAPPGQPPAEWTTLADDSLEALAARLDRPLADVIDAAAAVPGLLQRDVTVAVPAATLRSVAADLQAPLALLVDLVADQPYLLRLGAQLPGTPAVVAPGPDGQPPTLTGIAQRLGTTAQALAATLADAPGLLAREAAVNLVRRTYPLAADDTLYTALDVLALDLSTPELLRAAIDDLAAVNATVPDVFARAANLIVPAPVRVARGDTLGGLAAAHGLTAAELGRSIAGRTDVLQPNVPLVLAKDVTVVTGPADSLEGLAARAGVVLDDVLTAVAGVVDLLATGAVWALPGPAHSTSHPVVEGDTLESIAASVAAAFAGGSGDASLVTPSWVVETQLQMTGIVRAGAVLTYLSRVPGFSLSGGSITLAGTGQSTLTLLFHTASNVRFSSLSLDLQFQVTQLEHGISGVPWAQGYESSSWSSFVLPPRAEPIGTVDIPIPLRVYPVPPSVTGQRTAPPAGAPGADGTVSAAAVTTGEERLVVQDGDTTHSVAERAGVHPATVLASAVRHALLPRSVLGGAAGSSPSPGPAHPLPPDSVLPVPRFAPAGPDAVSTAGAPSAAETAEAADAAEAPAALHELRRYDYSYTFTCRRNAQDAILLGQERNAAPLELGIVGAGPSSALPVALAQFASVQQALEQDLARLAGAEPATAPSLPEDTDPGVGALRALADIATAVSAGWAAWTAPPAGNPDPPVAAPAVFALRRAAMPTGQTAVHVVPLDATDTSHPPAVAPGVHLHGHEPMDRPDAAGPTVFTRSLTPLVPAQGDTGSGTGTLELGTPTETLPGQDTFTVTVADLDLGVTQNIWGDVRLTRNAALLPGVTTNHAFVYAVPPARMPTPAIPHVSTAEPFDVAAVPFRPGGAPGADAAVAGERQTLGTWLRNLVDSLLNRSAVLPGDTLDTLAQRYDLDLPALAASIADVAGLLAGGTALTVPGGAVIEVQSGDTLASIAAAASVSPADLAIAGRSVAGLLVPGTLVRPVALARTLRLSVDYGFVLATDGAATADQRQQLVSRLPVLLQPAFLFDSAVDLAPSSGFCAELAGRLTQWAADRRLDPDRGLWLFDVSLYTTLPDAGAGGADLPRQVPPLLELRSVQLDRRLVLPDPPAPSPAAAVPTTG